jgi:hypothetical protein
MMMKWMICDGMAKRRKVTDIPFLLATQKMNGNVMGMF